LVEWAIIAFDYIPWSGKLAFHLGELCSVEIQARRVGLALALPSCCEKFT
jgi:hypothetical protein